MEPVSGINSVSGNVPGPSAGEVALASFAAKICAGGDIAGECMALMAEDSACQSRVNLQGVRVHQRAVRQARRRRMELLKKQWVAKRKRGFWGKLGGIFKTIAKAVGAIMTICCPPFGGLVLGGATVAAAGCSIAGSHYQSKAAKAAANVVKAEHNQQLAQEARGDMLQSLQNAAEMEKQMVRRITALVKSETKSVVMK